MPAFKKVPPYVAVGTTPADMVAAEALYVRLQQNPAYDMTKGPRRAAVYAKFQCGLPLTPIEAVEFGAVVPEGYLDRAEGEAIRFAEHRKRQDDARLEWEKAEHARRQAEAQKPRIITDPREAQACLSPADYMAWCDRPENQKRIAEIYN